MISYIILYKRGEAMHIHTLVYIFIGLLSLAVVVGTIYGLVKLSAAFMRVWYNSFSSVNTLDEF